MIPEDLLVVTQRHRMEVQLQRLLQMALEGQESSISVTDLHPLRPDARLVVFDVVSLFPAHGRPTAMIPTELQGALVVGFREDEGAILAALREGIFTYLLEDLRLEALAALLGQAEAMGRVYSLMYRHWAERVRRIIATRHLRSMLTRREAGVVDLLCSGCSAAEIASALGIEAKTVKNHLTHAYQKLGVSTRAQAMARLSGKSGSL